MLYKIINDDLKAWALIHIWGLANSLSALYLSSTLRRYQFKGWVWNPNFETKEVSKQVDESRL